MTVHRPQQAHEELGAKELMDALRFATAPADVLVIAGEDWSSSIPFFAQRRAFAPMGMLPNRHMAQFGVAAVTQEGVMATTAIRLPGFGSRRRPGARTGTDLRDRECRLRGWGAGRGD